MTMKIRNLLYILASVFTLLTFISAEACTSAVISGRATKSGRPLLWKHRDTGEENNKIKFSFRSNVESGELNIVLYDSNGNIVKQFPKAKELVAYVVFDYDDTYTLTMTCSEFVGKYSGKVSIKRY